MPKKILIIDDDKDLRFSTRMTLENAGFYVEEAINGEDGLKKADSVKPDLFIVDLMMETFSAGSDVVTELRAKEEFKKTPLIMLSSVDLESQYDFLDAQSGIGANVVEKKPLAPETLLQYINSLLKL